MIVPSEGETLRGFTQRRDEKGANARQNPSIPLYREGGETDDKETGKIC